jgi:hypothetical protein
VARCMQHDAKGIAKQMIGGASMMTFADYLATTLTVAVLCALLYFVLFIV